MWYSHTVISLLCTHTIKIAYTQYYVTITVLTSIQVNTVCYILTVKKILLCVSKTLITLILLIKQRISREALTALN